MANTSIKERVKLYCTHENIAVSKFEKTCGLSNGYFNGIKSRPSYDKLMRIFRAYPNLNPDWFVRGEGEMLKNDAVTVRDSAAETGVPFYDIDVTCGITESFADVREEPQFRINYAPLNDCDAAFPVYGDSMEPDFYAGDVVMVREIHNVDSMLWGEPYLIITNAACDNLRTIKNVYLSDDRRNFILRASNPRYNGDTIVARENVLKIFLIKGKLCRRQL